MKRPESYEKQPGVMKAAKMLGCTYQHLRLCIMGKRKSYALYSRYLDLQLPEKKRWIKAPPKPKRRFAKKVQTVLVAAAVLLGCVWPTRAQVAVCFSAQEANGATNDVTFNIRARNVPNVFSTNYIWMPASGINLRTTNGSATTKLNPGAYTVAIMGLPASWTIFVTNSLSTLSAASLTTGIVYYSGVQTISGGPGVQVTQSYPGTFQVGSSIAVPATNYWLTFNTNNVYSTGSSWSSLNSGWAWDANFVTADGTIGGFTNNQGQAYWMDTGDDPLYGNYAAIVLSSNVPDMTSGNYTNIWGFITFGQLPFGFSYAPQPSGGVSFQANITTPSAFTGTYPTFLYGTNATPYIYFQFTNIGTVSPPNNYWIDPLHGNDTNIGSETLPWRTLTNAVFWANNSAVTNGPETVVHLPAGDILANGGNSGEKGQPQVLVTNFCLLGAGKNSTFINGIMFAFVNNSDVEGVCFSNNPVFVFCENPNTTAVMKNVQFITCVTNVHTQVNGVDNIYGASFNHGCSGFFEDDDFNSQYDLFAHVTVTTNANVYCSGDTFTSINPLPPVGETNNVARCLAVLGDFTPNPNPGNFFITGCTFVVSNACKLTGASNATNSWIQAYFWCNVHLAGNNYINLGCSNNFEGFMNGAFNNSFESAGSTFYFEQPLGGTIIQSNNIITGAVSGNPPFVETPIVGVISNQTTPTLLYAHLTNGIATFTPSP